MPLGILARPGAGRRTPQAAATSRSRRASQWVSPEDLLLDTRRTVETTAANCRASRPSWLAARLNLSDGSPQMRSVIEQHSLARYRRAPGPAPRKNPAG